MGPKRGSGAMSATQVAGTERMLDEGGEGACSKRGSGAMSAAKAVDTERMLDEDVSGARWQRRELCGQDPDQVGSRLLKKPSGNMSVEEVREGLKERTGNAVALTRNQKHVSGARWQRRELCGQDPDQVGSRLLKKPSGNMSVEEVREGLKERTGNAVALTRNQKQRLKKKRLKQKKG